MRWGVVWTPRECEDGGGTLISPFQVGKWLSAQGAEGWLGTCKERPGGCSTVVSLQWRLGEQNPWGPPCPEMAGGLMVGMSHHGMQGQGAWAGRAQWAGAMPLSGQTGRVFTGRLK